MRVVGSSVSRAGDTFHCPVLAEAVSGYSPARTLATKHEVLIRGPSGSGAWRDRFWERRPARDWGANHGGEHTERANRALLAILR